jgi:hypothetical protein
VKLGVSFSSISTTVYVCSSGKDRGP